MTKIFKCIDDDFFVDRLSRRYGVIIFVSIATLMAADFILRDSLTCWNPAQFTASHKDYTNEACARKGALSYRPPDMYRPSQHTMITHFDFVRIQYLSIVLCLQALLFRLPQVFWANVTKLFGFPAYNIIACTKDILKHRQDDWDCVAQTITTFLTRQNSISGPIGSTIQGYILFPIYLLQKFGYVFILLAQFVIISVYLEFNFAFLQTDFSENKNIWLKYVEGNANYTIEVDPFPKNVLCSFQIRHQARVHSYVVQCDARRMVFTEFYMFIIWLFLWIAIAVTALSCFSWIMYFVSTIILPRRAYMKQLIMDLIGKEELAKTDSSRHLSKFVSLFTQPDGRFIIALLEENTSTYALSRIIKASWKLYMEGQSSGQIEECGGNQGQVSNLYPSLAAEGETVPLQDKSVL